MRRRVLPGLPLSLGITLFYVGLIVVLWRWRPDLPPRRLPRERLGVAMAAGIRYVRLSPPIRIVLLRAALFGVAASALSALMPLVARDLIGGGPVTFGLLLGAFGVGAVGGALIGGRLRGRLSIEAIVRLAALGLALGAFATALGMLALALPALLLPRKGRHGLIDYDKVFSAQVKGVADAYEQRCVDREAGALVVVRPDQYIAHVLPLQAHDALAGFFARFMGA